MQERDETTLVRALVQHKDDIHYVLNTHSLHNYQLIAEVLPVTLQRPDFRIKDPSSIRIEGAKKIRGTREMKKAERDAAKVRKAALKAAEDHIPTPVTVPPAPESEGNQAEGSGPARGEDTAPVLAPAPGAAQKRPKGGRGKGKAKESRNTAAGRKADGTEHPEPSRRSTRVREEGEQQREWREAQDRVREFLSDGDSELEVADGGSDTDEGVSTDWEGYQPPKKRSKK